MFCVYNIEKGTGENRKQKQKQKRKYVFLTLSMSNGRQIDAKIKSEPKIEGTCIRK